MSTPQPPVDPESYGKAEEIPTPTAVQRWWESARPWALGGLITSGALVVLVYLGLVGALYFRAGQFGDHGLRWSDFALAPFRWSEFRAHQGRMLNARGLEKLRIGEWNEAFFNLHAGLVRSPREIAPRIAFANLYATFEPQSAIQQLEFGLGLMPESVEFMEALVVMQRKFGGLQTILDRTAEHSAKQGVTAKQKAILLIQRADVLLEEGRAAEAAETLRGVPVEFQHDPQFLDPRVRSVMALGNFRAAHAIVESEGARLPRKLRLQMECEIAVGLADDERVARTLRQLAGVAEDPAEPLLTAFVAWHKRSRTTLRDDVERTLLDLYGEDRDVMRRYGQLLVSLRDNPALIRLIGYLEQQGASSFLQQVQLTELALRESRFEAAFRILEKWEPILNQFKGADRSDPEFIRRLTRAANDDNKAQATSLATYLAGLPSAMAYPRYLLALEVLTQARMTETAAAIAAQGLRKFPMSDLFREQTSLLVERRQEDQRARAAAAVEARRQLVDGRASLALIDQRLKERSYASARSLVREVRESQPVWLAELQEEVDLRDTQLEVLMAEPLSAREAVRRALDQRTNESFALRLLQFAQASQTERPEMASMIRQEVAALRTDTPALRVALQSAKVEEELLQQLRGANSALSAIDHALGRRDPELAVRLIALVRRTGPAWHEEEKGNIALREIHARLQLRQRAAVPILLRDLLWAQPNSARAVLALVRQVALSGDYDDALFLAKQLSELAPYEREVDAMIGRLTMRTPL